MALQPITPGSLVFGDVEGRHRNPEHVSRQFTRDVDRCGRAPGIRLHDLRHMHATQFARARAGCTWSASASATPCRGSP